MKFNWGIGITLGIAAFMGFIIFMVVQTFQTNAELTAVDYYSQELAYQNDIDARQNTEALEGDFEVRLVQEFVLITFPEELQSPELMGEIHFYRAEDSTLDRTFQLKGGLVSKIPQEELAPGAFDIRIQSELNGKSYAYRGSIQIPYRP